MRGVPKLHSRQHYEQTGGNSHLVSGNLVNSYEPLKIVGVLEETRSLNDHSRAEMEI